MMQTLVRSAQLADWALAHGRSALTTTQVAELLGVPETQVSERLASSARRGEWATPARGLWLPVPPEYRTWGAAPGIEVVDLLAHHLGVDYYVGWLSAAEHYGAAHHAPQVFQVAVSRQVRDRRVGRTRFWFRIRADAGSTPVRLVETWAGNARVSTPEATALDLVQDVNFAGGIDNVATVLVDLDEEASLDGDVLAALAADVPAAAVRRLGWVLEEFGGRSDLEPLRALALRGPATPARVDPGGVLAGPLDPRWNIRVNRDVEPDL